MDDDLRRMTREQLVLEIKRLRDGIRKHRDSSGHNLRRSPPELWGLLPEPMPLNIAVPPWPKFVAGRRAYQRPPDKETPGAPLDLAEYDATDAKK